MREVDKTVGARIHIQGRKAGNDTVDSMREDINPSKSIKKHPNWVASTNEDAPMSTNCLKGMHNARFIHQLCLKGEINGVSIH